MNRLAAVRNFLQKDSRAVETTEFMQFWKACTEQERAAFAESAAKQLGVELIS